MFLAEHTVQDIRDLAHAKDAEITAIEAARAKFVGPFSDPTWDNEWRQFRVSYEAAKSKALEDKTSVPFLDDSMRIADADYRAFVATLEPLYDLVVREQHAIGKTIPMAVPQPLAEPDSTFLHATRGVDEVVHTAESFLHSAKSEAKNTVDWLDSPWIKLTVGLGIVTLAATALDKVKEAL